MTVMNKLFGFIEQRQILETPDNDVIQFRLSTIQYLLEFYMQELQSSSLIITTIMTLLMTLLLFLLRNWHRLTYLTFAGL